MHKEIWLAVLIASGWCSVAYADDDGTWAARAQVGYAKTGGNTDTETANGLFHVAHVVDQWKFLFGAEGVYGSTKGETTAQDWDLHFQANYNFTDRLYGFGSVLYDNNKFSGFVYQETAALGGGYQIMKTDNTKLTGQVGVGFRRLRPENLVLDDIGGIVAAQPLEATSDAVVDAALNLEHSFNSYTKIIAGLAIDSGKGNTMTTASGALQVKMTNVLSLAAGYQWVHNSEPPMGVGSTNTLATLNLVYELKNKKLAPE
jgi:putative salt-induced outer membrane protein